MVCIISIAVPAECHSQSFTFTFFCLTGQNVRLEPVTAPGILSLVLNIMCASLNIIRGVHLIEYTFQVCAKFSITDFSSVQHIQ